eukprot:TRINITY_DN113060_c0_g1_i1.p2 TRINITY_DN113060_c0_g1~~TRINITY_DN113060_c0_g1_i1.p2  ORF type:complete len:266 (-),score=82.22 TRINITY_DN113060_c0_g1_i1:406-1203(-)
MTKIFIGGLPPGLQTEEVKAHFDRFGAITDAIVMRDRNFGFVTFQDPESVQAALQEKHSFQGQEITVKQADGKGGPGGKGGGGAKGAGPPTKKIFLGGLPQNCEDDRVRGYFAAYGNITDCVVMKDKETGRTRGFGFVEYDSTDAVDKVMADFQNHMIDGKWIECKRSIPKEKMDAQKGGWGYGGGGKGGYGKGWGGKDDGWGKGGGAWGKGDGYGKGGGGGGWGNGGGGGGGGAYGDFAWGGGGGGYDGGKGFGGKGGGYGKPY